MGQSPQMMDFLFDGWPNGAGPMLVQLTVAMAGAAAGIRLVDDLKKVGATIKARRDIR